MPFTEHILFQHFNAFGRMDIRSAEIIVRARHTQFVAPYRSRSRYDFADSSSESDSDHNGRHRPTPSPVSTRIPQPCSVHRLLCLFEFLLSPGRE